MQHRLNSTQRGRLSLYQTTREYKARRTDEVEAGIAAGSHSICEVCGNKGKKAEPAYDICMLCWYSPPRSGDVARVIAQTDERKAQNG